MVLEPFLQKHYTKVVKPGSPNASKIPHLSSQKYLTKVPTSISLTISNVPHQSSNKDLTNVSKSALPKLLKVPHQISEKYFTKPLKSTPPSQKWFSEVSQKFKSPLIFVKNHLIFIFGVDGEARWLPPEIIRFIGNQKFQ